MNTTRTPRYLFSLMIGCCLIFLLAACGSQSSPPATGSKTPTSGKVTPGKTPAISDARSALANPYPPYGGTVALNDPLRDNSKGYRWEVGSDDDGICQFSNAAYIVDTAKSAYVQYCKAVTSPGHFTSFVYQARMTILKGDRGGLTFLVNDAQKTFYYFGIGQDGSYILDSFKGEKATILLKGDASALIHTGLNSPNVVAVVLTGSNVDLYVNMHWIVRASNIVNSPDRLVGLAAQDRTNHTEVVFNDAMIWSLQ